MEIIQNNEFCSYQKSMKLNHTRNKQTMGMQDLQVIDTMIIDFECCLSTHVFVLMQKILMSINYIKDCE